MENDRDIDRDGGMCEKDRQTEGKKSYSTDRTERWRDRSD